MPKIEKFSVAFQKTMSTSVKCISSLGSLHGKFLFIFNSKEKVLHMPGCIKYPYKIDARLKRSYSSQKSLIDVVKQHTKKSSTKTCYLLDQNYADELAEQIIQNRHYSDSVIVENNPGPGVLTKAILEKKEIDHYLCTEKLTQFHSYLKSCNTRQQKRKSLFIYDFDLFHDRMFHSNEYKIMEDLKRTNAARAALTVINMIYPKTVDMNKAINKLTEQLVEKDGLYQQHPTEFFFFSPPNLIRRIMDQTDRTYVIPKINYTMNSVLFNLAFSTKFVTKLPTTAFVPVYPKTKARIKEFRFAGQTIQQDEVYMIQALPNENFQSVFTRKKLHHFEIFVRQMLRPGAQRGVLVARMEELIPMCGLRLLKLGFTMTQKTKDLSPQEILHIFLEMQSWPEFEESPLFAQFSGVLIQDEEDFDPETDVKLESPATGLSTENDQQQIKYKPQVRSKKSKFLG